MGDWVKGHMSLTFLMGSGNELQQTGDTVKVKFN